MPISRSVMEMSGAPPADFAPGRMLNGVRGDWWHDIRVANPTITIGAATVETSAAGVQIHMQRRLQRVIPLSLEISDEAGTRTALPDVPFEVSHESDRWRDLK